jgi:SnoaL-like domain
MTDFDFDTYVNAFNTTDEASFVDRFYTKDLVMDGPFGTLEGSDKWLHVLNETHVGIKEDLKFLTVVRQGDVIMAESEGTFTALKDSPEFGHGPLKQGESITVKFFTKYVVRDGKIAEMKISWWDPKLRPPLGQ